MNRAKTDYIVIHCSKTNPTENIGLRELDRKHRMKGFLRCGYHYVIKRDGTLQSGRDQDEPGAHCKGFNDRSIGICLIGGVDAEGNPEANYTEAQWDMLEMTLQGLLPAYPDVAVVGHNELHRDNTCPGFDVFAWTQEHFKPSTTKEPHGESQETEA